MFGKSVNLTEDFYSMNYIHPWKQPAVKRIIDSVKDIEDLKCIVVFGSALERRCRQDSDIDIVIFGDSERKAIFPLDIDVDVLYEDTIDRGSVLWKEIYDKGVVVYAKNLT